MDDAAVSSMLQQDASLLRHTLSVHQVAAQLAAAGVPRSDRRIKHFCQTQFLDAVKIPGPTGEQWHIAPASVPKLIGDLQQWDTQRAAHGGSRLQPAATDLDTPEKRNDSKSDAAGSSRLEPAATDKQTSDGEGMMQPAASPYVMQLEKRIEEKDDVIGLLKGQLVAKDDQIGELSTRYRETHALLGAMQRMLAPLLGQADPYKSAEKREVDSGSIA